MDTPPELVRAAQSGDRDALEDLIARSYRPAYTLALRLLGNPDDAAEATQEAYVRVVRSIKGFREPAAFPTWLFRIVSNVCMSQMRKRGRQDVPMELPVDADIRAIDVEEMAVDRVFSGVVEQHIRALPATYRAVVVLRDVYDLSGEDVARILGISAGAVKVRLHRAHRKLRDDLLAKFPDWGRDDSGRKASA